MHINTDTATYLDMETLILMGRGSNLCRTMWVSRSLSVQMDSCLSIPSSFNNMSSLPPAHPPWKPPTPNPSEKESNNTAHGLVTQRYAR